MNCIKADYYHSSGGAITNFSDRLPSPQSELAQAITKDTYDFGFLSLEEGYKEEALETELEKHLTRFLLELGTGFAYMGRQKQIIVAGRTRKLDMLFFHIHLSCYIVVELDSVFAIGMSAKDNRLRYIKQVKVRAGAFKYDTSNVLVYEIEKESGFLKFSFRDFATEEEHLRHREPVQANETELKILDLDKQGLSCRKIAEEVGLSKSTVNNIIKRNKQQLSTIRQDTALSGQMDTGQANEEIYEPTLL